MLRRIEDEASRTGLLVEDLLLLARLDQERPLERGPVDLLSVTADVVHDAAVVRIEHLVRLLPPEEAPHVVHGDDGRLRQVVGNLVANAPRRRRASPSTGSGLGVSIVAAQVAAHGGTVVVRSEPGDGTAFTVRLPAS